LEFAIVESVSLHHSAKHLLAFGERFACRQAIMYTACSALWLTELDGSHTVSDSSQARNGSEASSNSMAVRQIDFV
jgi:hypothetical protein